MCLQASRRQRPVATWISRASTPDVFKACRSESIDYAVMEKTADAAMVVPLDAGWSDVGSWSALHEAVEHARRAAAMSCSGDVLSRRHTTAVSCYAESRLVATVGLRDHVVVETKDAVLVAPK